MENIEGISPAIADFIARSIQTAFKERTQPTTLSVEELSPSDATSSLVSITNNQVTSTTSNCNDHESDEEDLLSVPTNIDKAFDENRYHLARGGKRSKDGTVRKTYKCVTCQKVPPAKVIVDLFDNGKKSISAIGTHDHQPTGSCRVAPDVKNTIIERAQGGGTVGQIHQSIVLESPNTNNRRTAPNKKQVKNIIAYHKTKKVNEIAGKLITTERSEDGNIAMIIIPKAALPYLKTNGRYVMYVDGTFDMVQDKLTLTTILYDVDGIALPVAWLIHSGKSEEDYYLALQDLKRKTNFLMEPRAIFLDYEVAMKKALGRIYPSALLYGDYFHFMQANVRWLSQHGYSDHVAAVTQSLRILWHSPSLSEFNSNVSLFKSIWEMLCYPYCHYFEEQWLKNIKPVHWASYGRAPNVPSGDNTIEGWHNRIKQLCNSKLLAKPQLLLFLYEEFTFWFRVLNTPHLKKERLDNIEKVRKYFQKKKSLEGFDPKTVRIEEIFEDEIAVLPAPASTSALAELLAPSNENPPLPSTSNSSTAVTVSESQAPATSKPSSKDAPCVGSNCNKNANKNCSNKMCQTCCAKIITQCSIAHHRHAKIQSNDCLKKYQQMVDEARSTGRILWLRYSSGRKASQVRAVKVKDWLDEEHSKMLVDDMIDNDGTELWEFDKTYFVTRITDISWNSFN